MPRVISLHYVSDQQEYADLKPWNISHASFTKLLDYLQAHSYTTLTFEDLVAGVKRPAKPVILTFDDCVKSLWDFAIPQLLSRNMKAVFYMPTSQLGGHNEWDANHGYPKLPLMESDDLAKLADAGMEVGSHAHLHRHMEVLPAQEVMQELELSKKILEKIIKKPVVSIAYPFASIPKRYNKLLSDAGYLYGISINSVWESKYAMRRWIYTEEDHYDDIAWRMSGVYNTCRAIYDKTKVASVLLSQSMYKTYAHTRGYLRRLLFIKKSSVIFFMMDGDAIVYDMLAVMDNSPLLL